MEQNRMMEVTDRTLVTEAVDHYRQALSMGPSAEGDVGNEAYDAALVNQCDALIQLGNFDEALIVCREATTTATDDPNSYYNVAAVYALTERVDDAFRTLEKNFDLGDRDYRYLIADKWFENLHGDPRFDTLIARMKNSN